MEGATAVAVPLGRAEGDRSGETLPLIDITIINAEGRLLVQTIWVTMADRRDSHRLTRCEKRRRPRRAHSPAR